ncbi:outer membrane beta-barrel protein [Azospirillum sp. sgz302134]
MKTLISAAIAATLAAAPALAADEKPSRSWYVGADFVTSFADKSSVSGSTTGSIDHKAAIGLTDLKVGFRPQALNTATGDVRFETELASRSLKTDKVKNGNATSSPGGYLSYGAIMNNVYYDFHTGTSFTPYVGGGLGASGALFSKYPGLGITDKSSEDPVLAYQVSAGVSYAPEALPGTE